jgi:RHS repeat-associated protein
MKITHKSDLSVIQADDYFPFGLAMAGTSYKQSGTQENKFMYNGVELQEDLGLGYYQTIFRMYDPTLGRFIQLDPLADFYPGINPFSFGYDNPILYGDPDGLGPMLDLWRNVKEGVMKLLGYKKHGSYDTDSKSSGKRKNNVYYSRSGKKTSKNERNPRKSTSTDPVPNFKSNSGLPIIQMPMAGQRDIHRFLGDLQELEEIVERPDPNPPKPMRLNDKVTGQGTFPTTQEVFIPGHYVEQNSAELYTIVKSAVNHWKNNRNLNVIITISSDCNCPRQGATFQGTGFNVNDTLWARLEAIKQALINLGIPSDKIRKNTPINTTVKEITIDVK